MSVGIEINDHIGLIELQEPPHNFFHVDMVRAIADALDRFDADPDVRCAVLAAQGKSFCAGARFGSGGDELVSSPADLYEQAARLCDAATPVIAAVHGAAIGGGLGVATTATMRVTCPEARFAANFVKLGIHHGFGLTVTLPALLGPSRAAYVLLSGNRFKGEEATELGIADVCVPQDQVRDKAFELAGEIASGAPLAIKSINRTLRLGLGDLVREATRHEADEQSKLMGTDDAAEGIKAVSERRPGDFTGR